MHFGKLGEFCREVEGWQNYVERLKFLFQANGITDGAKKRVILLSSYNLFWPHSLFWGLCTPDKPADKSFNELVDSMQANSGYMLNTRDCLPEESASVYVASIRRLTEHCGYGEQIDSML